MQDPTEQEYDRINISPLPKPARQPPGFSTVTNNNHVQPEVKLPMQHFKVSELINTFLIISIASKWKSLNVKVQLQ